MKSCHGEEVKVKVGEKTNIIKIKRKKNKEKHEEKTKKVNSRIQKTEKD